MQRIGCGVYLLADEPLDAHLRAPLAAVHDVGEHLVGDQVALRGREEAVPVLVPEVPARSPRAQVTSTRIVRSCK